MTSSWRIARPSLHQIVGVLSCSVAAGPIAILLVIVNEMLRAKSPVAAVFEVLGLSAGRLLFGWAFVSLIALPSVVAIALGAIALARANRDTFVVSFACGTACAFVAISVTYCLLALIAIVEAATFNVVDVAVMVPACSIDSALYWLIAVRRDRSRRLLAERDARAISAME